MANANNLTKDRAARSKGLNFTVNVRMSREEIEAARRLGNGNISMGLRLAIRYANGRDMKPIKLSTMLRSAAVLAAELEDAKGGVTPWSVAWPFSYQLEETAKTLVPLDKEADAVLLHLVNTVVHIVIPVRDNGPEMSLNSFIN